MSLKPYKRQTLAEKIEAKAKAEVKEKPKAAKELKKSGKKDE